MWESHVEELLRPYCQPHPLQFGFSRKSGCGDALLTIQRAALLLAEGQRPVKLSFLSLDCRKAFDRIPTATLLSALIERNCPSVLIRLIQHWLTERSFTVGVEDVTSEWMPAPSGVPQGSRLGPLLYNIAVDSVLRIWLPKGVHIQAYADDLILLGRRRTDVEVADFQAATDIVTRHLSKLGLELNSQKSQLLNVSFSGFDSFAAVEVNGHEISPSQQLRYLGVLFDSRLNFNGHWRQMATSAKGVVTVVSSLVHRDPAALRYLYQERVVSALLHSLPFTPPTNLQTWRLLNAVPKFVAHLVTNRWQRDGEFLSGAEVRELAELSSCSKLAAIYSARFAFKAVWGCTRYASQLQRHQPAQCGREGLRPRPALPHPSLQLDEPPAELASLARLQPVQMVQLWNALLPLLSSDQLSSLSAFSTAVPLLYSQLPPDTRRMLFGRSDSQ